MAKLHNDLGYCYYKLSKIDEARNEASSSIEISENIKEPYTRASLMFQSANVLFYADRCPNTKDLALRINSIAQEYNLKDIQQKNYSLLANCYEKEKNYEKAIEYARKAHDLKDAMVSDRLARKLADERQSFQVMTNRKLLKIAEKENELKSAELRSQERINLLLGLVVLIALLTAGSLFYSNRQKQKVNQKLLETNKLIEKQNQEIKLQQETISKANKELKERFSELEQMDDEKSHLMSIVAHDLRTPLNSILGLCDLMEMDHKENDQLNPETQRYLDLIKESGGRMLSMINTLLNARKIESKQMDVNPEVVSVPEILQKVEEEHSAWLKRKDMGLEFSINPSLQVWVDRYLFQQVLENLISNAIKYSPVGTKIKVQAEEQGEEIRIDIVDQGPGISEEDQTRLFTKYQRLSAQPTGGEDSMGIGLSLVKKLTQMMKGKVWCESKLGSGSTFSVLFPKH